MAPHITHLTQADYQISQWSGGTTTQIAIAPQGALYADRDFLWRLSSATVDLDESDFTPLPDYHRLIAPLRGEMELTHDGGPLISLAPYQVHAFDGGADTHSRGRCVDFNLMLRKDRCAGSVSPLRTSGGPVSFSAEPGSSWGIEYHCLRRSRSDPGPRQRSAAPGLPGPGLLYGGPGPFPPLTSNFIDIHDKS